MSETQIRRPALGPVAPGAGFTAGATRRQTCDWLQWQAVMPVFLDDRFNPACLGDCQLSGPFGAMCQAHDSMAQIVVAGQRPDGHKSGCNVGDFDLVSGCIWCRRLAGGKEPQDVGVQIEQSRRLRRSITELKTQLDRVKLGGRSGQQHVAVADRMQRARPAEGSADFVTTNRLPNMVHL